jgi:hypothetical protein
MEFLFKVVVSDNRAKNTIKVGKGDHIWIQTSHVYATSYLYAANAAKSSFTGMLIHEL